MNEVFVVFYDEVYYGYGERGTEQRRIEGVFDTDEKARAKVRELEKLPQIAYADFDVFEVL
jgi:uncharacterized protein YutD